MNNKIWAFWDNENDAKNKIIFGYLNLCLKTWEKLDKEVVFLNSSNLWQYLSKKEVKLLLKTKHYYSLAQFSDAVRVFILHRYGGIYMDIDTIILNANLWKQIENLAAKTELLMIEKHIGWLYCKKNSVIIAKWYKELIKKLDFDKWKKNRDGLIKKYGRIVKRLVFIVCKNKQKIEEQIQYMNKEVIGWDYLSNSISNGLIENSTKEQYLNLAKFYEYKLFVPESTYWNKNIENFNYAVNYQNFWFTNKYNESEVKKDNSPFFLLHNSWTPNEYKKLSKEQFLEQDILLSKLLRKVTSF